MNTQRIGKIARLSNNLRDQQAHHLAKQLTDRATGLDQETGNLALSDHLATVLTEQLSRLALRLLEEAETAPDKQWHRLCQINRELSQLRRADHRALQLKMDRERWEWTQQQAKAKADREKHNARKSENRELGAMMDRFATDLNAQTRALAKATPRDQRPVSPSAPSPASHPSHPSQSPPTPEIPNPTESNLSHAEMVAMLEELDEVGMNDGATVTPLAPSPCL